MRAARDLNGFLRARHTDHRPGVAAAALESLRAVAPFDCATILEWDARTGRHRMIGNADSPAEIIASAEEHLHLEPLFAHQAMPTLRLQDIPVHDRRGGVYFDRYTHQPGYTDGLTLRLWAPDGRALGVLNLAAFDGSRHDDLTVDLLDLLAPALVTLLDHVPRLWPLTADLAAGTAEGLVVDRAGRRRALTAGADVELARPDGPLWPSIRPVAAGTVTSESAVVLAGNRVLAVSIYRGEGGTLVLHRTIPAPFGLSTRELQVLHGLTSGASNAELATRFGIAPRTVATHIERLLAKTGCPNRIAAARIAARLNLTM